MDYMYTTTSEESQIDYRTRRTKDTNDEKIVGEFLDEYFYPTFSTTITRNTDKRTQIKGLDLTVKNSEGYTYTIDEKAATRWAGRHLQTFAHEISAINISGCSYDGWLLDFDSCSEYLVEVWVDEISTIDGNLYEYSNISDATIILIKKTDLWNYLKHKKISSVELKEIAEKLRNYQLPNDYYKGFKVTQQMTKQEHGVNILIPRDTLINTISKYAVRIKNRKVEILRKQL